MFYHKKWPPRPPLWEEAGGGDCDPGVSASHYASYARRRKELFSASPAVSFAREGNSNWFLLLFGREMTFSDVGKYLVFLAIRSCWMFKYKREGTDFSVLRIEI